MVEIPLSQGRTAIIDARDAALVGTQKWSASRTPANIWYAVAVIDGQRTSMHRLLLGLTRGDHRVDHINGNGLDNRRANIRLATGSQNGMNRRAVVHSSRFKGVRLYRNGRWSAQIKVNGRSRHLGYFVTEKEAAVAYDMAARELFGEFARTNFHQ